MRLMLVALMLAQGLVITVPIGHEGDSIAVLTTGLLATVTPQEKPDTFVVHGQGDFDFIEIKGPDLYPCLKALKESHEATRVTQARVTKARTQKAREAFAEVDRVCGWGQ